MAGGSLPPYNTMFGGVSVWVLIGKIIVNSSSVLLSLPFRIWKQNLRTFVLLDSNKFWEVEEPPQKAHLRHKDQLEETNVRIKTWTFLNLAPSCQYSTT